jgi:hypothetical protein
MMSDIEAETKDETQLSDRPKKRGHIWTHIVPLVVVAVVVFFGARISFQNDAARSGCRPDPTAAIEALPSGAVWTGRNRCYILTSGSGMIITKAVTLKNATFIDPAVLVAGAPSSPALQPIIHINKASDVTLKNITLQGENISGGYHGLPWVGEEGIKINGSHNVTLDNINTVNTFGDGLLMDSAAPVTRNPSTNITVNGLTVTQAGRQGVTAAYVTNSTLNNVDIVSSADTGWDFESDITAGAANVIVNGATGQGVRIIEDLTGPITFNNANLTGGVTLQGEAAASHQPVIFNGGSMALKRSYNGTPPAGIYVNGPGNLTLTNINVTRQPGTSAATGLTWTAVNGGHITFNNSPVSGGPLGVNDVTSKVVVAK